ncbi:MAG: hypothetical protein V2I43_26430 [Parvularcula sp.]|jgi:hypothetical protein|nr:hypothetical protein [Parvularcula sp.]
MSSVLNEFIAAFSSAANASPLYVLLPLLIVAIAEGLQADGVFEVFGRAMRGLLWLGLAVVLFGGLMSPDRFRIDAWGNRAEGAFGQLLDISVVEALGFYLLLLVAIALIFLVRSVVRR